MDVSRKISQKISVLSFLAMVSVVYIHANTAHAGGMSAKWNVVLQRILTRTFTEWAAAFFFVVSGFWFARGRYVTAGKETYVALVKKKAKNSSLPVSDLGCTRRYAYDAPHNLE